MRPTLIDSTPEPQYKKYFDPENSLFELTAVKWIFYISILSALACSVLIAYNEKSTRFDLSGLGFNRFGELYKIPTAIIAVGLALIGLCGANHRSEQTKAQINRTSMQISLANSQIQASAKQNIFSNYYKHIEEFEEYAKSHLSFSHINIKITRRMHYYFFPEADEGNFELNARAKSDLEEFVDDILANSVGTGCKAYENSGDMAGIRMHKIRDEYLKKIGLKVEKEEGETVAYGQDFFILNKKNSRDFIETYFEIFNNIDTLGLFSKSYIPSERIKHLTSKLVLEMIPNEVRTNLYETHICTLGPEDFPTERHIPNGPYPIKST
jgi:hypothetical protein